MPRRTRKTATPYANSSRRSKRRRAGKCRRSRSRPSYTEGMRPLLLLALAAIAPRLAADTASERALKKLDRIESGHVRRGAVIVFTPAEMNAWARERVPQMYEGVREP